MLIGPDRNNATVVMNTTSGALPSGPFPTATVTVDGVGDFGSTEPSTEAGVSAADVTVTVTSTSTTVTNTRTVTASQVLSVASVAPSTGESTPSVFVTDSAGNCAPTTVTLTVAETVNPATAAQVNSTAKHEAPFTTLIIPDLYSKGEKPTQSVFSAHALNVTEETTTVTAEVTETVTVTASDTNIVNKEIPATTAQSDGELTSAGGSDSTVTVTVFEQPTVIITSTMIGDSETPSPAISTNTAGILSHSCASGNITEATSPRATVTLFKVVNETYTTTVDGSASLVTGVKTILTTEVVGVGKTVFATGTIAALSNTVASLMTVTVQPAPEVTQPAPEATQASPGDGTSPAAIPEESSSTQGKRAFGAVIIGCIVVLATTVLCML